MNFLAQDAVYLDWFTGETAIDTGTKTHVMSVNADGDVEVHQLVHSTGAVTTTTLESSVGANDHNIGGLVERSDGKLLAFWTAVGAGTGITYKLSSNANDSTSWGGAGTIGTETHSYAWPIRLSGEGTGSGRIYLFTRTPTGTKRQQYYYSDDDGSTWNGEYDLMRCIDSTELSYCVFSSNGTDRIDVFSSVVEGSGTSNREDVYHCYLQDEEAFASDGTSIGSRGGSPGFPLTVETDCTQVYDSSTGDEAWVWACVTDSDEPAVVFATFPNRTTNHDYYWAKYDSTNDDWNDVYKICDAGGLLASASSGEEHYSCGICFDGQDPDAVYASIGDNGDGSRLVRMTRSGSTWSEDFTVAGTPGRGVQNIRPTVPFVTSGTVSRRCQVIWLHGNYNYADDYSTEIRYLCDAVGMQAAGWSHFIPLDIATSQVTGDPEVNGHMMALITHDSLSGSNATAFWNNVKNGGADIRVSVGATNTSGTEYDAIQVLPCDVYYCDTSTEKLKLRVCLPEAVTGATIQIWVGNSSASARTTRTGHDSDGFPGSYATYSPQIIEMVPDFTVASGNITDRAGNGHTLTVAGSPDYAQTDQWGGPGAMYFTGSDGDRAYADETIGRCAMACLTPDLAAGTEDSEMWWFFQGNRSVGGRYVYARIDDTSAPHDADTGAIGSASSSAPKDDESFSGFVQVHAVMEGNASINRSLQVNDRTQVSGSYGTIGALDTTCINGLRTPSDLQRGKGTYHEMFIFSASSGLRYLHTDGIDTYWANHNDPAAFWDEGTVVPLFDVAEIDAPAGNLSYSAQLPTIATGVSVAAPAASFGVVGRLPSIQTGSVVSVPAGTLTLPAQLPTVATGTTVAMPSGQVVLTAALPSVSAVEGAAVLAPAGSFGLTGRLPSIESGVSVGVPSGALALAGIASELSSGVSVTIPASSLAMAAQLPAVATGASVSAPAASLAYSAILPSVSGDLSISVPRGTLTMSAQLPTVSAATPDAISVGSALLSGVVRGAAMH